ncbi:MAG TPA: tetraacyldisaccharide 4'-kinase [Vicinamibacterales bacterium]
MVLSASALPSGLFARATALRRRYYAAAGRARQLRQPVISVGNLRVGGSGKTPVVARLAAMLIDEGERPAILSRGYARREPVDGVTVVSDGTHVLADLDRAGDEPLMLARALPGAGVFVSADRFWAGAVAERRFGATVHLLDDGFQHVRLRRDVDLVVTGAEDEHERTLPAGPLREPFSALRRADALLVTGMSPSAARELAERAGVPHVFTVTRAPAVPRHLEPWGVPLRLSREAPVVAVAGIARPERFFSDLERDGWQVAARLAFRDHQPFGVRERQRIADAVRNTGAAAVLTTEKDAVRLLPHRPLRLPIAWVPLSVSIEPADQLARWLMGRLAHARSRQKEGC